VAFSGRRTRPHAGGDILSAMDDFTRAEAAGRAGLEPDYLDRLIGLGLINPGTGDRVTKFDIRKARIMRTLEDAGIAAEHVAAGLRSASLSLAFLESPVYERFATYGHDTFRTLSERTGLPLELLMLIREAAGGAVPDPDDRVRDDEALVIPYIEVELAVGYSRQSVERSLRVLGDSLRRAAETESDAWRTDIMAPYLSRPGGISDLTSLAAEEPTLQQDAATDQALLALWHAQQAQAWTGNIISGFESVLTDAGLLPSVSRPPAICFLDITGYTRLTYERGDEAAADLAAGLNRLVTRSALEHSGRPVKWLGDGVMVYFRDPGLGVISALEMVDGVADVGLPPAHVGLHAGPVLFQEGDYFGRTVNMASRIADYARPGEVLVTQEVVDESEANGVAFREIGPVELKGIGSAVNLHAAQRSG
jgi:adenylate cyclase